MQGTVGADLSVEQGHEAGRLTALSVLASLKAALGELDRVQQWLRVTGYVRCTPDFLQTTRVVNGFSELILAVYGQAGRHARAAPGVVATPLGLPLVVEATVALG
jgi:enamine deaminase RidA (YjgF/YER057c/UK114 family)